MNESQKSRHLTTLVLALGLGFFLMGLSLFWLDCIAIAAPPKVPLIPQEFASQANLTITGTKTSTPAVTVEAGSILTYTIAFSSDVIGTILVTDTIPDLTEYITGTISETTAAPTNIVVPDDSSAPTLAWAVSNQVTNSSIILTFAVIVTDSIVADSFITNTAWLSEAVTGVYYSRTHTVAVTTQQTATTQTVYLPVMLKNFRCTADNYEPNDGRIVKADAREWTFGSGATISGNFCVDFSDPADYFWLDLSGGTLNVTLSPPSTADYDLYIYKGENAASIAASSANTGFGVGENISYSVPGSDTYFIRVHPFNKGSNGDSYTLKVTY